MKRKSILIVFASLFLVGLISAGLVYKFVINKPHVNYEKARPTVVISAADLFSNYKSDRLTAEHKFNGKVVMLDGQLSKVEVTDSRVTGVFVFDEGMFGDEGIRCTMLEDQVAKLKSIPEGSDVKIKGFLTGYNDTDIILEQCSVIL